MKTVLAEVRSRIKAKRLDLMEAAASADPILRKIQLKALPTTMQPLEDIETDEILELARRLNEVKIEYSRLKREIEDLRGEYGV